MAEQLKIAQRLLLKGVYLCVADGKLTYFAGGPITPAIQELLDEAWSAFEERAAICKYDGRMSRAEAEEASAAEMGCMPTTYR